MALKASQKYSMEKHFQFLGKVFIMAHILQYINLSLSFI